VSEGKCSIGGRMLTKDPEERETKNTLRCDDWDVGCFFYIWLRTDFHTIVVKKKSGRDSRELDATKVGVFSKRDTNSQISVRPVI